AVHYVSSTGIIDAVSVLVPRTPSVYYVFPFWITGPEGGVTVSNATVSGDGATYNHLVHVDNVASGVATITGGSFTQAQTPAAVENIGLFVTSSLFRVTGASFHLPGK